MASKHPDNARGFLALIAAGALFAAPAWAQEAEDGTESASGAAQEEPEAPAGTAAETGAEAQTGESTEGETAAQGEAADDGKAGAEKETGEAADGETAAQGETGVEKETEGKGEADGGPLIVEAEEGSVLDDQTFEGEDDDFTPSEEIPVDQPIPFPVDI